MLRSVRRALIGATVAVTVGAAHAITVSCPLTTGSVAYRATQPWPFDTVELSTDWVPFCTNFACQAGAKVVGSVAATEASGVIGFDVYGSDC